MKVDFNNYEECLITRGIFALCFSTFSLDLNANSRDVKTLGISMSHADLIFPLHKTVLLASREVKNESISSKR